ncbi:glycoside hydrolase family 1 protein (macronuclear) [Tetrahymena thermophila SB210]|uniref:Glycoside hydrolase family 1 protein n=1 Tax=Tetrahymena thermophila (strain SB210) TaxID=312017 RepID=I7MMR2_TETTS|nr:glycoside hydrolase family 1 protein [Tetrahymena thermophila SB210]EAS06242.2 glycoside hydrolase family 1 protein [Tetrahymena thermophila SB210]|eukprot:XP_001026487.2 glycoside hydrolase family 1 protein [Tetrahymena thermophila SB210]
MNQNNLLPQIIQNKRKLFQTQNLINQNKCLGQTIIEKDIYQEEQIYDIQDIINQFDCQLNIFTGLSITNDGVIRLFSNINQVCLGFQQQDVVQIQDLIKLNVINIVQQRNNSLIQHSTEQAINFMSSLSNFPFQMASQCFKKTGKILNYIKSFIDQSQTVDQCYEDFKNEEFQNYTKVFFQFLEEYSKLNPYQMYHYQIGRLNLILRDMEYYHTGYSKPYLEFLGMDYGSLSQLLLRRKKVDLVKDKQEITNISLQALSIMYQSNGEEQYESEITTFDGYPIKIKLIKKNYTKLFGIQNFLADECEYQFLVTEIDVDLKDLQQLIQYREKICQRSEQINIQDFLRRELSYLFEDVEYTIDSYYLFEKFYSQNIITLKQIEQFKKKDFSKICGYRQILS